MLESMRKSAGSWMIKLLLMFIVLAFVFMGAGSFVGSRSTRVASVNGEPISVQEYQRAYSNIINNLRSQFGGNLNEEMLKMFNVKKQALDSLIDSALLLQVAKENDMRVPTEALAESITSIPSFQNNGAFDHQRYEMVLGQNRLTPTEFEAMQKESMMARKVQNFVTNTVAVSEAEARAWYNWQNTEISVDYAVFKPSDFQDTQVSEDEIKAYYENRKADYKTAPEVKVQYVRFSPEDYLAQVNVTDEEIEAYYADRQSEYKTPETVSARHILIKVAENAEPQAVEEKRQSALEIMEKAKAGKDFTELAKAYSEGPSSKDGGDLGTFSRGDMVKPFSDKAFSMEPGQISEPVRTQFGWHIIKVDAHNPESVKALSDVGKEIRKKLAGQKARNIAYDQAAALYDISFDGDDLVKNAEDLGLTLKTTGFFTQADGPEGIENAQAFAKAAFDLPLLNISDIKEFGDSYYLIQVTEKEAARVPELTAVKAEITRDATKQKQNQTARDAAQALLEAAREKNSLADAAADAGKEIKSTGLFSRNDPIPGIGRAQNIANTAFSLSAENPIADSVQDAQNSLYMISFKAKKAPEAAIFKENRDQTVAELTARKQQETFASWLDKLRASSDIEISPQLLEE